MNLKGIKLLMAILVMVLMIVFTSAAENITAYELKEVGMTVSLPTNYLTATRDMKKDSPFLSATGIAYDSLMSYMQSDYIYLDAVNYDGLPITAEAVIRVTVNQNNDDFNLISDAYIVTSVIPSVLKEYESSGMPVRKTEIYQHGQAKFIKIYAGFNNGSEDMKFLQYFTGYDNHYITIKIQTNAAEISSEHEATLQQIIDSVIFSS